jgi:uncharacterized protein YkwD
MLRASAAGVAVLALAPAAQAGGLEDNLLREMNEARAARGAPALRAHDGLAGAAQDQSRWMAANNVLGHRPDLLSRLRPVAPRYRVWGENLAWTPRRRGGVARRTVRAWLRSPEHRELLLMKRLDVFAVSAVGDRGAVYVTAEFAGR